MKIIRIQNNAQLVEYIDNGNYKRCVLPIGEKNKNLGIPYGLPFENFVNHPDIPNEFRRRGIWTIENLMGKQQAAYGAIQAAYGQDLAIIIKLAKKEENND